METSTNQSEEQLKNKDQVSFNVTQANKDLVLSIKEKLEAISSLKSIFRVPEKLRHEANEKVYRPEKVSIGPLHHGNGRLKSMEDHKWRYLYTLLSRRPNLEASLNECVKALGESEKTARNFYAEELILTSNEFTEITLVDGCFIIELFLKYALKSLRRRGDPIFATPGLLYDVACDLILLENQIPLLILQRLFEIVPIPIQCDQSLSELALRFFRNMLPGDKEVLSAKFSQEGNHLLDLIRQCFLPTYTRVESKIPAPSINDLDCATKLQKNGIKFMKFKAKSLLDMKFANGALEIAPLTIHQFTEILFSNLIALEQHQNDVQPLTSYALLMKAIICSESDAKLFCHLRILISTEYTEKGICGLFKRLCKNVEYVEEKFFYAGLVEQIIEYKKSQRSWRQELKCSCLKTPTFT